MGLRGDGEGGTGRGGPAEDLKNDDTKASVIAVDVLDEFVV